MDVSPKGIPNCRNRKWRLSPALQRCGFLLFICFLTKPVHCIPVTFYTLPPSYYDNEVVEQSIVSDKTDTVHLFTLSKLYENAKSYLKKYGYLDEQGQSSQDIDPGTLTTAIQQFQQMADIPTTGKLDYYTLRQMSFPRCGVKDTDPPIAANIRKRRSKSQSMKLRQSLGAGFFSRWWFKCDFTWNVLNGHPFRDHEATRVLFRRAIKQWEDAVNRGRFKPVLTFTEVVDRNDTDLQFSYQSKNHGDNNNFDGPAGVLAHAFFPYISGEYEGLLHIDADENWKGLSPVGQLLYYVILHELGHVFGLTHSNKQETVMYSFLGYSRAKIRRLHQEDIDRIRKHYVFRFCDIYGKKRTRTGITRNYKDSKHTPTTVE